MYLRRIFLLLILLAPTVLLAKSVILYDDSSRHLYQDYKSISILGQSIKIDKDYTILTEENTSSEGDKGQKSYSIILKKGDELYRLDGNNLSGLNRYIISPYFSDRNFIGFVQYTENILRGDFYVLKKFYIFNKVTKEVAIVRLNYTSISNNTNGEYDYKLLDQNYIKRIIRDDSLNLYTIESIYEQNNPAIWGVSSKGFKSGHQVSNSFKFKLLKNNKIKCENLKNSILDCTEGFMQMQYLK